MKTKGYSDVWSITPDAPVYEALKLMSDKDMGILLLIEAGKPVGIISEYDAIVNSKINICYFLESRKR